MKTQFTTHIFTQAAIQAGVAATLIVSLLTIGFLSIEPQIGHANESADFTIRQTITDETSFLVNPASTTMSGTAISGVTGGTATGTSQFVVLSNNASGYSVTIDFFDNAGDYAMLGNEDGGEEIRDYALGAGTPTLHMTASTAAQFAYTVQSTSTSDTVVAFRNNGTNCGAGSQTAAVRCWKSPSTSPVEIVNRSTSATAGATSTLVFKVHVPAGATPTPTAQVYTATATLSVVTQ